MNGKQGGKYDHDIFFSYERLKKTKLQFIFDFATL